MALTNTKRATDVYFNILEELLFPDILAMIFGCYLQTLTDGEEGI